MRLEPLPERPGGDEAPLRDAVDLEETPIGSGVDGPERIDGRNVHLVPDDAMGARVPARGEGRGVDAGDGGKDGMAVRELHAFGAQPVKGGRAGGGDRVGPEPVHHEDDDEARAHRDIFSPGRARMGEHSIHATIARDKEEENIW